jgi:NAD(P)H-hydrate epimerase
MYAADRLAVEAGIAGTTLMFAAGKAVVETIIASEEKRPIIVLCGPGNNGGDGFVIARLLSELGWTVRLMLLGREDALKVDAAHHAEHWGGPVEPLKASELEADAIIVDALFGAGLKRPLTGEVIETILTVERMGLTVYGVDVPSGLDADSGKIVGEKAFSAKKTVTFQTLKAGHLLYPGRELSGEVIVADIGIPPRAIESLAPDCHLNQPELWLDQIPRRKPDSHKYHFGHALVVSGEEVIGATILASRAALRVGAGLVTLAAAPQSWAVQAAALPSAICKKISSEEDYLALLAEPRINSVLIGPGAGVAEKTRQRVIAALIAGKKMVLDADALTAFSGRREDLFTRLQKDQAILTPHDGEFVRLFPGIEGDRLRRAREAARVSGAVIVSKGADSVVAAPNGRATISTNAPPWLATAGTGDVLAGLVVGLLAQGVPTFEAASAAVWIHGASACKFGPGMIAEDVPSSINQVLREIL